MVENQRWRPHAIMQCYIFHIDVLHFAFPCLILKSAFTVRDRLPIRQYSLRSACRLTACPPLFLPVEKLYFSDLWQSFQIRCLRRLRKVQSSFRRNHTVELNFIIEGLLLNLIYRKTFTSSQNQKSVLKHRPEICLSSRSVPHNC